MMTIDRFQLLADSIAEEMPPPFFDKLNGGIILLERAKLHEKSVPNDPLYILGEYNRGAIGRYISIYYGSFMRIMGYAPEEMIREKLREVIAHEFRHHVEWLSGSRDLEIEDQIRLSQYTARVSQNSGQSS